MATLDKGEAQGASWARKTGRIGKLVIVNLLVATTLFLALELGARLKDVATGENVRLGGGSFITPWITTRSFPPPWPTPEGGVFNHRNHATPLEKPPGTVRFIAVGGSTTLNQFSFKTDKVDLPLLLQERLNQEFGGSGPGERTFEGLNAGANGFSSAHTLVNLQFRLLEYHPDVVLILHNINDLDVNYYGSEGALSDYRNKYMRLYFLNDRIRLEDTLWSFLYQSRLLVKLGLGSLLAQWEQNRLRAVNDGENSRDYSHSIEAGMSHFRRNLELIIAACRRVGAEPMLLTQPALRSRFDFAGAHQDKVTADFARYNRLILETAASQGVVAVDVDAAMPQDPNLFNDSVHQTAEGVRRFAETVLPSLTELLRRRGVIQESAAK